MGREVRMVPPDWQHPKRDDGSYQPIYDRSYKEAADEWEREVVLWANGEHPKQKEYDNTSRYYWDWTGSPPDEEYHRPEFPESSRTHFQMYEDTSEGTPISPVMETPEALARWLTDNNASAFAGETATYEQWLSVARGGWAPSAVMTVGADGRGTMQSGVAAMDTVKGE